MTTELPGAVKAAQIVKNHSEVPVVLGGWDPTLLPEQMAKSELIDYVISGEGDEAIVNLANHLVHGNTSDTVPGLTDEKILYAPKVNCETLPPLNYDLWPNLETLFAGFFPVL